MQHYSSIFLLNIETAVTAAAAIITLEGLIKSYNRRTREETTDICKLFLPPLENFHLIMLGLKYSYI